MNLDPWVTLSVALASISAFCTHKAQRAWARWRNERSLFALAHVEDPDLSHVERPTSGVSHE